MSISQKAEVAEREAPGQQLCGDLERSKHIAEVLKALAHPIRLRIVAHLCQGNTHVGGLADQLGVTQAIVSQQLRILRMKGLVLRDYEGGFAIYRLGEPKLVDLVRFMEGCS
jgi:DNA-binding transcriptional ArsR family regulator